LLAYFGHNIGRIYENPESILGEIWIVTGSLRCKKVAWLRKIAATKRIYMRVWPSLCDNSTLLDEKCMQKQ